MFGCVNVVIKDNVIVIYIVTLFNIYVWGYNWLTITKTFYICTCELCYMLLSVTDSIAVSRIYFFEKACDNDRTINYRLLNV